MYISMSNDFLRRSEDLVRMLQRLCWQSDWFRIFRTAARPPSSIFADYQVLRLYVRSICRNAACGNLDGRCSRAFEQHFKLFVLQRWIITNQGLSLTLKGYRITAEKETSQNAAGKDVPCSCSWIIQPQMGPRSTKKKYYALRLDWSNWFSLTRSGHRDISTLFQNSFFSLARKHILFCIGFMVVIRS